MSLWKAFSQEVRQLFGHRPEVVSVPEIGLADGEDEDENEVLEHLESEPSLPFTPAEEWGDLQAFAAKCEAEAIHLWGLSATDPRPFCKLRSEVERAVAAGETREQALLKHGVDDPDHWKQVEQYFEAKWSCLVTQSDGTEAIAFDERFVAAQVAARS